LYGSPWLGLFDADVVPNATFARQSRVQALPGVGMGPGSVARVFVPRLAGGVCVNDLADSDLRSVFETIWSATLGLELLDPAGSVPPPPTETLCASVHLTGAWCGVVSVHISEGLARRAASAMFGLPVGELTQSELHDAIGEIANMTGGGVKALLPAPSHLSLPSVVSGASFSVSAPGGSLVNDVAFQLGGSQIRVTVIARNEGAPVPSRAKSQA
jgi:chemotaxis protein CheX